VLNVTLLDVRKNSLLYLALATVYRPPGTYADFLKEFADFLSDLLDNVDKAIIDFMHSCNLLNSSLVSCLPLLAKLD